MRPLKSLLDRALGRSGAGQSYLSVRTRLWTAIIVGILLVGRPARLESIRWWHSPPMVATLGLTTTQSEQIDRIYQERSRGRGRCIERVAEASNRVDRLIRDGAYDQDMVSAVEAVMKAAADERALTHAINDEVAAVLTEQQQRLLVRLRPGPIVE